MYSSAIRICQKIESKYKMSVGFAFVFDPESRFSPFEVGHFRRSNERQIRAWAADGCFFGVSRVSPGGPSGAS